MRLSSPLEALGSEYSVVVVGSGYGGGVAASRLARAGVSVSVLERGGEWPAAGLPHGEAVMEHVHLRHEVGEVRESGASQGLFDCHLGKDVTVLNGWGLGGGSLVGGQVAMEPDAEVFSQPLWPSALVEDLEGGLREGFERARAWLEAAPFPARAPASRRWEALERSAAALGTRAVAPEVAIAVERRLNAFGQQQAACQRCGDCLTGCPVDSTNTVARTYLHDAWQYGADVFTGIEVRRVERTFDGKRWRVYFVPVTSEPGFRGRADEQFVTADCVVLAAGTLGTTEILLRSRQHGLSLSDRLGRHFSGNGNLVGVAWKGDRMVHSVAVDVADGDDASSPGGPAFGGVLDLRPGRALMRQLVVHDLALPAALAAPATLSLTGAYQGGDGRRWLTGLGRRIAERLARQWMSRRGALARTQFFFATGHDSAAGEIRLEDDRLVIDWPGLQAESVFDSIDAVLARAARANGATYRSRIRWHARQLSPMVSMHPLGGCVMAECAEDGVTNHRGEVFCGQTGTAVHEGLLVADGSLIPMSLGVGPMLTITALAERNIRLFARSRGWTIDEAPPVYGVRLERASPRVCMPQRLSGFWLPESGAEADCELAAETGRDHGYMIEANWVVEVAQLATPEPEMRFTGQVIAPALSAEPLSLVAGEISRESAEDGIAAFIYRGMLNDGHGGKWLFEGHRLVCQQPDERAWTGGARMPFTIRPADSAAEAGNGVMEIDPGELVRELAGMSVFGAATARERLGYLARAGRLMFGELASVYGRIEGDGRFGGQPPRYRRALRVSPPAVHYLACDDHTLRLQHFSGGSRGVVLLLHRPSASDRLFTLDTVHTNLVEFLCREGFDVWVLGMAGVGTTAAPQWLAGYRRALNWLRRAAGVSRPSVVADGEAAAMALGCVDGEVALMVAVGMNSLLMNDGMHPMDRPFYYMDGNLNAATRASLDGLLSESLLPTKAFEPMTWERLQSAWPSMPVAFIVGAEHPRLGIGTARAVLTQRMSEAADRGWRYHWLPGYGDVDCLVGRHAEMDVYTVILQALDAGG